VRSFSHRPWFDWYGMMAYTPLLVAFLLNFSLEYWGSVARVLAHPLVAFVREFIFSFDMHSSKIAPLIPLSLPFLIASRCSI